MTRPNQPTRRAWPLARRLKRLATIAAAVALAACAALPAGRHNAAGGYVDACGELPGLIGNDC